MTNNSKKYAAGRIWKTKTTRERITFSIIIFVILAIALWAAAPLTSRLKQQEELRFLAKKSRRIKTENVALKGEITKLRGSDDYIEWLARKDLGLIKNDEEAYLVIGSPAKQEKRAKRSPQPGAWQRIKTGLIEVFSL